MSPPLHQNPLDFDSPEDDHDHDVEFEEDVFVEAEQITCWRCGKPYDENLSKCPACLAQNREIAGANPTEENAQRSLAIVGVIWAFLAITVATIACTFASEFSLEFALGNLNSPAVTILGWMGASEVIHIVILVAALLTIRTPPHVLPEPSHPLRAWCLALPLLGVTLALNYGYHTLLLGFLKEDLPQVPFAEYWPALLVIVCLQPAIVEEIFFRHLAMKATLEVVTPTQAVLITSIMFAMAHLGQPLSLPVLGWIGLVLGYLRLTSGGLVLPMLFHFLHNLAVIAWKGSL